MQLSLPCDTAAHGTLTDLVRISWESDVGGLVGGLGISARRTLRLWDNHCLATLYLVEVVHACFPDLGWTPLAGSTLGGFYLIKADALVPTHQKNKAASSNCLSHTKMKP